MPESESVSTPNPRLAATAGLQYEYRHTRIFQAAYRVALTGWGFN